MKRMVMCVLVLGLLSMKVVAQTKAEKATAIKKEDKKKFGIVKNDSLVTIASTGSYSAFAPASTSKLGIADPTVNLLNRKALGSDDRISGSGIAGMPKGSYGFANGRILLRNTTATSSGTGYGSGAVGTGTSLQGIGASETILGVNGKSPYAGSWLWGDKHPVYPVAGKPGNEKSNQ